MFNAKDMLGQFMQSAQGTGAAQPSNNQSGQLLGGLGSLLNNPGVTGALSGAGGGLLAGLLLGNKKARNIGGKVAMAGGAVALGAIALKAFKNWQSNNNAQAGMQAQGFAQGQNNDELDFDCLAGEQQEIQCRAMLSAIIAAAKADGHFDDRERTIVREQMNKIGDADTVQWVQEEIRKPLDPKRIAAMATSPEMASEIYLASLMVIDQQNEHEHAYLDSLAAELKLPTQLKIELGRQFAGA